MSNLDEDRSVYNGLFEVEVLIDRPVGKVWSQYLDLGSWVTSHDVEEVQGSRGTAGSIMRLSFKNAKEMGMPEPHHHFCKIIKVVSEQQYVLKTYTEKGGSYGMQIVAFDDTRFLPARNGTRVIFNIYGEFRSDAIAKNPTAMNLDFSREGMLNNLKNLKSMVESRP